MELMSDALVFDVRSENELLSQYPDNSDVQFETDWQNAISGEELVKRVHSHIDKLYARNQKL
jgi:rhodanese-related sulfurtransferase